LSKARSLLSHHDGPRKALVRKDEPQRGLRSFESIDVTQKGYPRHQVRKSAELCRRCLGLDPDGHAIRRSRGVVRKVLASGRCNPVGHPLQGARIACHGMTTLHFDFPFATFIRVSAEFETGRISLPYAALSTEDVFAIYTSFLFRRTERALRTFTGPPASAQP